MFADRGFQMHLLLIWFVSRTPRKLPANELQTVEKLAIVVFKFKCFNLNQLKTTDLKCLSREKIYIYIARLIIFIALSEYISERKFELES